MSKVTDLLNAGVVTQDPESEKRVIFNVPLYLPKIAIEGGAFELFASAYGWEEGDMPAHEKCIEIIWQFVNDIFDEEFLKQKQKQAIEIAKQELTFIKSKE